MNICFEGVTEEKVARPTVKESKGPLPIEFENGYVAFEDLPEDKKKLPFSDEDSEDDEMDDFDLEEEDDDEKEDEEEIVYDEKE